MATLKSQQKYYDLLYYGSRDTGEKRVSLFLIAANDQLDRAVAGISRRSAKTLQRYWINQGRVLEEPRWGISSELRKTQFPVRDV
jgi:hypothetical protein